MKKSNGYWRGGNEFSVEKRPTLDWEFCDGYGELPCKMLRLPKIEEAEARFLDVVIKILGGLIALFTVLIGFQTLGRQGDQIKIQQQQLEATQKEQFQALEEEYHRRFWEKKLDLYVQLLKEATALAIAAHGNDYDEKVHVLIATSVGELQVVASPNVDKALGDVLRVIGSFHTGKAGSADAYAALCKLAIACRQDSVREFQLDPKQQEEFEQNAQIMAKLWDDLLPKAPTGLHVESH